MKGLKGAQRKYLRGLAHHFEPVVQIGKNGVTDSLMSAIDQALEAHELIKVKFNALKEERDTLAEEMAGKSKSELVGIIGNVAIFYRRQPDEEKRMIELPSAEQ